MSLEKMLIKGRKCGSCSACCVSLRINEPTLKKQADVPCSNLRPQGGCAIYEDRPSVCKTWYCGWRILPMMGPALRPDRSNLLVRFSGSDWTFQPVSSDHTSVLMSEEVLSVIGGLVSNGQKTFISIPTKEGYCHSITLINDVLGEAIRGQSFSEVRGIMMSLIIGNSQARTDPISPLD
ncbi:YkgJ family cysteine cluster protein [Rahnella rivi]|uniref:YkgJ family cysteine cluster protein n=1 Tax=Rahnella rivi TaxID=2816249 RepID=UPI0039BDF72F